MRAADDHGQLSLGTIVTTATGDISIFGSAAGLSDLPWFCALRNVIRTPFALPMADSRLNMASTGNIRPETGFLSFCRIINVLSAEQRDVDLYFGGSDLPF